MIVRYFAMECDCGIDNNPPPQKYLLAKVEEIECPVCHKKIEPIIREKEIQ